MTHRLRFFTVLVSLVSLLFTSAAVAAHACAGVERAFEIAQMVEAGAPCAQAMAAAMEAEQGGLCHGHCQSDRHSADGAQPTLWPDLLQLGAVLRLPAGAQASGADRVPPLLLQRTAGPPLAIRHCCLRI